MGRIKNSYIIIPKDSLGDDDLIALLHSYIDSISSDNGNQMFEMQLGDKNYSVTFHIHTKATRLYLEYEVNERLDIAAKLMSYIDEKMRHFVDIRKRCYVISDYDGLSQYYCEHLYPKFGEFERKLRQLMLIILVKAYGKNWFDESASPDVRNSTIKNVKSDKNLVELAIENMDISTMQDFLFGLHEGSLHEVLLNELSHENIQDKSANELRKIIDALRPISLWNRCFSHLGPQDEWSKNIESVRETRNKIAHHKRISAEEYEQARKKIIKYIRELEHKIVRIKEEEMTEIKAVDVLESWSSILPKLFTNEQTKLMMTNLGVILQGLTASIALKADMPYKDSMQTMAKGLANMMLSSYDYSQTFKTYSSALQNLIRTCDSPAYRNLSKALVTFSQNYANAFIDLEKKDDEGLTEDGE